jgi:hypothetical protein
MNDPFEQLDFAEQIKPEHWKHVHSQLDTPALTATLFPDGTLKLHFHKANLLPTEETLSEEDVKALTAFLSNHVKIENEQDLEDIEQE